MARPGLVLGLGDNNDNVSLDLANHTASGIWQKSVQGGVISRLTGSTPEIKVGNTDFFTFTGTPKAELVGESMAKGNTGEAPTKATAKTYKVHVTHRVSEEVLFADEDYQLGLMDTLVGRVGSALSRAVDLVAFHGINPKTGLVGSVDQYVLKSGNKVKKIDATVAGDDLELALKDLALAGYVPSGVAADPVFAVELSTERDNNGVLKYPNINITGGNAAGLTFEVGDTVSARHEVTAGTGVQAIVGDWKNAFKWGVARNIGLRTYTSGDPDGNGDLARYNEILIRAEAIFGFVFFDEGAGFTAIGENIASS